MRKWIVAGLLVVPHLAFADATVAGRWEADLGSNVKIAMDVSEDGNWSSQTVQGDQTVASMSGTYRQTPKSKTSGMLVFTPTKTKTTAQHGAASVERDTYTVSPDGQQMKLTSGGDTMVFHKQ
jgi:hypothetical protein